MMRWTMATLALLALSGCPGFGDKTLAELEGVGGDVTYHADIRPIIEARCFPCHTSPPKFGAPNPLDSYDLAVTFANRIHARAVLEGTMPPGGGVSDAEKARIAAWIQAGTPEGTVPEDMGVEPDVAVDMTPDPEPDMGPEVDMDPEAPDMAPPPPPPPTWDDDVSPVMDANCAFPGCHGGGAPQSNLDLTTYDGYIQGGFGGDLTGGGDPARSGLVDRLRARDGLPLMPQNGTMLDEPVIEMIEEWIAAGSPEN